MLTIYIILGIIALTGIIFVVIYDKKKHSEK